MRLHQRTNSQCAASSAHRTAYNLGPKLTGLTGKYVNSKMVPEGRRRSRLFAHDSTPTSRHGGRGLEDELFSPGAPAPDGNDRYGSTNQKDLPLELQTGMYPGYGAIGALQAICDGTFVAPVISY